MMKKVLIVISLILLSACVSQKQFDELETKYYASLQENARLKETKLEYEDLIKKHELLNSKKNDLENDLATLTVEKSALEQKYNLLNEEYNALKNSSSKLIAQNSTKNKQLLNQLEEAQSKLNAKEALIKQTALELEKKISRINNLESLLKEQKNKLNLLKSSVENALKGFEGKGITVEERDGRIYVSMDNKLLFSSGKWQIEADGKRAIKDLAEVLAAQIDLNITIEGHTDSDAINGSGAINDNWDLSVKRATEITKLLQKNGVDPTQMTAAGRSEYLPLEENTTPYGKAKNRRVEVILTPDLNKINQLLQKM